MCSLFTACNYAVDSAPLSSPATSSYCHEDILQLTVEGEEADSEGSQHGQVIVVVSAAALALAAPGVTVATAAVAAVAAIAVTSACIGVPVVGIAADHLITLGRPSRLPLVCIDIVILVEVMVILRLVLIFV